MPKKVDDSGPAFPSRGGAMFYVPEKLKKQVEQVVAELNDWREGMSLRDYFAAHAPTPPTDILNEFMETAATYSNALAEWAYAYADSMLVARVLAEPTP